MWGQGSSSKTDFANETHDGAIAEVLLREHIINIIKTFIWTHWITCLFFESILSMKAHSTCVITAQQRSAVRHVLRCGLESMRITPM